MFYELYRQTIEQLTKTLSYKFSIPVSYSKELRFLKKNKKWQLEKNQAIIPLSLNEKTAGCIQVQSYVEPQQLNEIYNHVQWTLNSLEKIFQDHGVTAVNEFPLFIPQSSIKEAFPVAMHLYENSSAQAFIHCDSHSFDPSFLEMENTLIFISDIESLSKENQKVLSDHLQKNNPKLLLVMSSSLPSELSQEQISSSLMQCLNSMEVGDLSVNII